MASDGLLSMSDSHGAALFPRMRGAPDGDCSSANSQDSAQQLGRIFHAQQDTPPGDLPTYPGTFATDFDTDLAGFALEADFEETSNDTKAPDTYSLDSSVLRRMGDGMVDNDGFAASQNKFKYLHMYEAMVREKHPDSDSVFALSGLDDFTGFLRKLQLDDMIKRETHGACQPAALLSVVDGHDLAQKYTEKEEDEKVPRPSRLKLRWNLRQDREASHSVLSELAAAGKSQDSDNSRDTGEKIFLQRKLRVRHLQMISFGGTLGVGLYLNSGKAFTIAGGFGTVLAFVLVGVIVLATIISFCEMVTFVSVVDGVLGLSARFVDESFGFATGWVYFLSFSVGLAGEIVASVIILSYFPETKILHERGATVGFVTLFLVFCVLSNMIDVRIFGEIEYIASLIKVVVTLVIIVVMIVINRGALGSQGAVGFKYWQHSRSDFDNNLIFGLFRPTFDLKSNGMDPSLLGIGGDLGRFLSLLTALTIAAYAYSGTEIVCIAACEAKDPRKALPSATKRVFWRILIFYVLSSFMVSLNIYAGDPRLLRYYSGLTGVSPTEFDDNYAVNYVGGNHCNADSTVYAGFANGSQSPWTVAFQSVNLCSWSSVANAFLVFFALSCGNSQLYVSSRTIYSLALQHKAPAFLKKCNRFGIPYNAVLAASLCSLSAYICVSELATNIFQDLTSIISSSGVLVWFAMCLSYIRFYYGLRKRPDIISRNDKAYPYRSPFQPYSAIVGLVGSGIILLAMGYPVFLKDCWDTMFFFSSYGTLILFAILYFGHRVIKGSRILSLEALDFDLGRRENDIYIWDGGKEYDTRNVRDLVHKFMDFMA